jgi:MFS transporter, putative metabolite transport protein
VIIASLLGAVVTWLFRIETTGVNLDHIGEAAGEPAGSKGTA